MFSNINQPRLMCVTFSNLKNHHQHLFNFVKSKTNLAEFLNTPVEAHTTECLYPRVGNANLPYKYHRASEFFDFPMPKLNEKYQKTFSEITDSLLLNLKKTKFDKPWRINWSGGIDSTVILTSILKNLNKSDFENIIVACNRFSIYENPEFYNRFIKNNFQTVETNTVSINEKNYNDAYVFYGDTGDKIFNNGAVTALLDSKPELHLQSIKKPAQLLDYISKETNNPKYAQWLFSLVKDNANDAGFEIKNYHDWDFWCGFNFLWITQSLAFLHKDIVDDINNWKKLTVNCIKWYEHTNYQKWALANNDIGIKFGKDVSEQKLAAKQYIYEFDKNYYYFNFKPNINSGLMRPQDTKKYIGFTSNNSRITGDDEFMYSLLDEFLES